MKVSLAIALTLGLSGCVQPPSAVPLDQLNSPQPAGIAPTDEEALHALKFHLERSLKDPGSVKQFRVLTQPTWAIWRGTGTWINAMDGGWLVCYELNAKNSYGGYTGLKTQGVVFHRNGDRLVPIQEVNWSSIDPTCPLQPGA